MSTPINENAGAVAAGNALQVRNPNGVQHLEDQMVFLSREDDPKVGFRGLIGPAWNVLGINNQGSDVGLTRTIDSSSVAGTGFGVIAYNYTAGEVTGSAEIIDDNEIVRWIEWPDNVVSKGVRIDRNTNKTAMAHVLIVNIRQDGIVELKVTRAKASLTISEQGRGQEKAAKTVDINYRADAHRAVFETVYFKMKGDTAIMLDPIRFVPDAEIKGDAKDKYQIGESKPEAITEAQNGVPARPNQ